MYLPSESKIGSGYQAHYMANAFVERGHRVTMFSLAVRPDDANYDHRQIAAVSPKTFRFAWNLRKLEWSGFDVIHAHGDDYLIRRGAAPIHIRTMHGSCLAETLHIPRVKEKLRMFMLGLSEIAATFVADRTVCVSRNTCVYYPWVKRVIVNGVDTSVFKPAVGEAVSRREAEPTILFVGTYQNRKRGKLLMDAFASVIRPALPACRLQMVCADAPPAPGVEVLGRLTTEELAERYRRAWVFCLPSSYEGFGVPYIEAMASGTPVVATPNVGAREVLGDGKYGILAQPEKLGEAILSLLQSEAERRRLSEVGLARAQDFAWSSVIGQYEMVYQEARRKQGPIPETRPEAS
jgi:glycosyltransferase involved in cell wall biosynthesis